MSDLEFWRLQHASHAGMARYRKTYTGSRRLLDGNFKDGLRLILYLEQGAGDSIMLLRYLPLLLQRAKVVVHCPQPLMRLVKNQWEVDVLDLTETNLPDHDAHICSLDFLYIFPKVSNKPYIHITETIPEVKEYPNPIGIAYEGSLGNQNNKVRCCPLKHFKRLSGTMFLLQHQTYLQELLESTEDMKVLGVPIKDFYDAATLINSMNTVVTIDSAPLHLASAMGKRTFAILPYKFKADPRWGEDGDTTPWYPTLRLIRQKEEDNWDSCFDGLNDQLNAHNIIS